MSAKNKSGRVYQRGSTWWIEYYWRGAQIRESACTDNEKVAERKLAERLEQLIAAGWTGPPKAWRETILYVVQRGDDGPIKVGISRNLRQRVRVLQNGNAERVNVLRRYRMLDIEKAIHRGLGRYLRLEGEWFAADLLPLIDRLFFFSGNEK